MSNSGRGGRYVRQPEGYSAFIPAPLPPDPPVQYDDDLVIRLASASDAVGRLDGVTQTIPNPDMFVAMYVRREAVQSSRIEGTESTLDDVLKFELDPSIEDLPRDVEEVVNYVHAMNFGLDRLASLPLSLRLIREIHAELLRSGRGAIKEPGEFRHSQNRIGPEGAPLRDASFVPPPPHEMREALNNFEKFLHIDGGRSPLVECALVHAQFETIHPFLDGNGRVGRLLITFLLVHRGVLHRPLLYLSHYLRRHRASYCDRLMAIREDGDWEGWLRFFLRGVEDTANEAATTARSILELRDRHHALVADEVGGVTGIRALDFLFERPYVNVNLLADHLGVTFATANRVVENLQGLGLLQEVTGGRRNRVFEYSPYLHLLRGPEADEGSRPGQTEATEAGPMEGLDAAGAGRPT